MDRPTRGLLAHSLALALGLGLTGLALAAPATPSAPAAPLEDALASPSLPPGVRAHLQALQEMRASRAATSSDTVDTTPPVLRSLDVGARIDVADPFKSLALKWRITDDLSGYLGGYATFTGPTGQHVSGSLWVGTGLPRLAIDTTVDTRPYMVPGTWTLSAVLMWDAAGNYASYDAAALQAVPGNHQFTVVNRSGGDDVPPVLVKGSIRTPTYSRAATTPGTQQPAHALALVKATDAGHGMLTGVWWADLTFCIAGTFNCWHLTDSNAYPQPTATGTLIVSGVPQGPTGVYELVRMTLGDRAGNQAFYSSPAVGGTTDFSAFFDTTTITVTP